VIGMTDLALETKLTEEQRNYLTMAKISANSLLSVINDILDFSKIEANKLDIENVDFSLHDCIAETLETLSFRVEQKNIELLCDISLDVPNYLVGDPSRLRQVIVNIMGNAIKFTGKKGNIVLSVEKLAHTEKNVEILFSIIDTGIGIPIDKQKKIFNSFSQVDGSTKRRHGGTGLGLSISSQLVKLMNGRIWVESIEGKGSKFQFALHFDLQNKISKKDDTNTRFSFKDFEVLVVDANKMSRLLLKTLLSNLNMKATLAESGQDALDLIKLDYSEKKPLTLMLINSQSPEIDCLGLAKTIRKNKQLADIKIIILNATGNPEKGGSWKKLKVDGYLAKPIKQTDLFEILTMIFEQSQEGSVKTPVTMKQIQEKRKYRKILLAEDNLMNQKLGALVLRKRGHEVKIANNGKEALALLENESFELILMDVQMPIMDGFEATHTIRKKEKKTGLHIPIVAMTAHAMKGDKENCLKNGMDDYIVKPLQLEELFSVVEGPLTF